MEGKHPEENPGWGGREAPRGRPRLGWRGSTLRKTQVGVEGKHPEEDPGWGGGEAP